MSELLKINVNEHTEKKNGLTYLSWAWAWSEVLKIAPRATWDPLYFGPDTNQAPYLQLPDGSMMVGVRVRINEDERSCLLPVMNHRNQAIKNPDAFAVNTAMMRCLAKAIAMHGLGLYIYAGEDLPESDDKPDPTPPSQDGSPADPLGILPKAIQAKVRKTAEAAIQAFSEGADWGAFEEVSGLLNQFPEGDSRNQIRLALWAIFKPHSALRAAIKRLADEEKAKDAAHNNAA